MRTFGPIVLRLLSVAGAVLLLGQADQAAPQPQHVYFDGVTSLLDRSGRSREIHVKVANWAVGNDGRIERFPKDGFLIVELFAGGLTTIIDGKRQQRVDGETWTVPARSTLSVETEDDTAVFQVIELRTGPK